MKNLLKKGIIVLLVTFILIQFYRPQKNTSDNSYTTEFFEKETQPPAPILETLQTSCYDCHSNETSYPWYYEVAPVSYWINDHITEGKKHLNFSDWASYNTKKKDDKIKELIEEVQSGEMPLSSYTWTHGKITEDQVKGLVAWAERNRVFYEFKMKYKEGESLER